MERSQEGGLKSGVISRRNFLKAGAVAAAGTFGGAKLGISPGEVINGLSIAHEYGPDVAMELISNPGASIENAGTLLGNPDELLDAYRLWKEPKKEYREYDCFNENLSYLPNARNNIIAFGDSNIIGPDGREKSGSPVVLFKNLAMEEKGFSNWHEYIIAESGFTTAMVRDIQVPSREAKDAFEREGKSDVWINTGGNDLSELVRSPEEVGELTRLAKGPFKDMGLLLKYTERIEDNLARFENDFQDLLFAIGDTYKPEIRQIVLMSAPDYGKAPAITTQPIDGTPRRIYLDHPATKRLAGNISILMNNIMFRVAADFQKRSGLKLIGIDTCTPDKSIYKSDQHLTLGAYEAIAEEAFSRMQIQGS